MANGIKGAIKHPGAFKRKAKAAGQSTASFRAHVLANKGHYSAQTVRQANLAKTLSKMHH
mgnify:CR=1 FL=1